MNREDEDFLARLASFPSFSNSEEQRRHHQHMVAEAEHSLSEIEETLGSFDRESIYKTSWYEGGERYWAKCETRQTQNCYFAADKGYRTRRFRREDVEADDIRSRWYEGYHLGRFIFETLLEERQKRADHLERCRHDLQTAIDNPQPERLTHTFGCPSTEKPNWEKEGF